MEEAEEVLGVPLVSHHQTSEVAEVSEQTLDLPAPSVAPELSAVLGLGLFAVPSVRRDQFEAEFCEFGV